MYSISCVIYRPIESIFLNHSVYLWPEDGPHWPKHVVSLINRIQRQLCSYVPHPLLIYTKHNGDGASKYYECPWCCLLPGSSNSRYKHLPHAIKTHSLIQNCNCCLFCAENALPTFSSGATDYSWHFVVSPREIFLPLLLVLLLLLLLLLVLVLLLLLFLLILLFLLFLPSFFFFSFSFFTFFFSSSFSFFTFFSFFFSFFLFFFFFFF